MFIYVIAEPDSPTVKIGRAVNVARRLTALQTGSPNPLVVRAQWHGNATDERALHDTFRARHVRGEWFNFDRADPVQAVTAALGRRPVEPATPERRDRGGQEVAGVKETVYSRPDGRVVVERVCPRLCVGATLAWRPGHVHEIVMSADEYLTYQLHGTLVD